MTSDGEAGVLVNTPIGNVIFLDGSPIFGIPSAGSQQYSLFAFSFFPQLKKYDPDFMPQIAFSQDNVIRNLEKDILLRVVDNKWIDHLHNIDMLRDSIGLRAYGQKDPLIEYKREAYEMFNKMMYEIQEDTVRHLFRTKFGIQVMGGPTEQME